ncbi:hypothetical protein WJX84_009680 [Apatococcus fuscideae]|uniref:4a-hydroxytetrahydrobiopterin dehydratase n=1 Tax=Apatococcus fuscideae TaxID=2026836 RepID=A0AAW1SP12_9CHLO
MLSATHVKLGKLAAPVPLCACTKRTLALRRGLVVRAGDAPSTAQEKAQGARDPFPGEVGSNFTAKPLSEADTMHIIRPPHGMDKITGLRSRKCKPCEAGKTQALDSTTINALRNQVPGWQVTKDAAGRPCIRQEWKVLNFLSGLEFFRRVGALAEEEGHHPDLHLEGWNRVYIQLATHSVGGLTENDFILASKINDLDTSDLRPRPKAKAGGMIRG